ncbi:MAG: phosphatase [Opitutaceae bacterium]|nr:phosphatase [Opitutaceae bacterium]
MRRVAVIDIGSNSIKLLVARRGTNCGRVKQVHAQSIDARISAGISQAEPRLGEDSMARGLAAIQELLAAASPHAPERTILVATSAVRDARNGREFLACVQHETGYEVQLLSGEAEANAIGAGLTCDPALAELSNFSVFDLGGGSLECLAFTQRRVAQALSLQLGCVRLSELFVPDIAAPFSGESRSRIAAHVGATLTDVGFQFSIGRATSVITGGSVVALQSIRAAQLGQPLAEVPSLITLSKMRNLLDEIAPLPLAQRMLIPGMPPARADVLPAALATLIAVAELGGLTEFHHSFYNLRYGLAKEALQAV